MTNIIEMEIVDIDKECPNIIGDFDKAQFALGYRQINKREAVVIAHFLSHLTTNGYHIVKVKK
ncbi:MAG: hypothetical protein COB09_18920 [Thalassobium sp.]|nr:MAG: hypothetical protein COB09_18920 [Thalassobium sp.]